MEYRTRKYPLFSACGLNCGLCPRHHTEGVSRCPGCAGEGFSTKHPSCGVLSCSQRKGIEYCYLCNEYPCKKYDGADRYDSFISHRNQFIDFDKAKRIGIDVYEAELNSKIKVLKQLLESYDDGRRKGFYCIAVNLLDLQDINAAMEQIVMETKGIEAAKDKCAIAVRVFQTLADERNIELKLRKRKS